MITQLPAAKEVVDKINKKMKGKPWYEPLRFFLTSDDMVEIIDKLMDITRSTMSFYPDTKDIFNFLEVCPIEDIKAVILIDIKPGMKGIPLYAHGSTFKQNSTGYKIIESAATKTFTGTYNYINKWHKQGVIVIPCSVTWITGAEEGSYDIWSGLISYILSKINEYHKDVPYILIKKKAISYKPLIKSKNIKEMQVYPYIDTMGVWGWCNTIIEQQGKEPIKW